MKYKLMCLIRSIKQRDMQLQSSGLNGSTFQGNNVNCADEGSRFLLKLTTIYHMTHNQISCIVPCGHTDHSQQAPWVEPAAAWWGSSLSACQLWSCTSTWQPDPCMKEEPHWAALHCTGLKHNRVHTYRLHAVLLWKPPDSSFQNCHWQQCVESFMQHISIQCLFNHLTSESCGRCLTTGKHQIIALKLQSWIMLGATEGTVLLVKSTVTLKGIRFCEMWLKYKTQFVLLTGLTLSSRETQIAEQNSWLCGQHNVSSFSSAWCEWRI